MSDVNLPAGAADDDRAPYNEKSYGSCSECQGEKEYCEDCGDPVNCQCDEPSLRTCTSCDGSGEKSEEQYEDEKESHEEDMRDKLINYLK